MDETQKIDSNFKLLTMILTKESSEVLPKGQLNPSLVFYYYLKTNQFDNASAALISSNVFFDALTYFSFLSEEQQAFCCG